MYGGAPRPSNNIMHVSSDYKQQTIIHELTHTFIEEYSQNAYINIKWLDEGLAEYYSWKGCQANDALKVESEIYINDALKLFNQQKKENKLYSLSNIMTEQKWIMELKKGNANNIYNQSFFVVLYLIDKYGVEKLKLILKSISKGEYPEEAIKKILNKDLKQIFKEFTSVNDFNKYLK